MTTDLPSDPLSCMHRCLHRMDRYWAKVDKMADRVSDKEFNIRSSTNVSYVFSRIERLEDVVDDMQRIEDNARRCLDEMSVLFQRSLHHPDALSMLVKAQKIQNAIFTILQPLRTLPEDLLNLMCRE